MHKSKNLMKLFGKDDELSLRFIVPEISKEVKHKVKKSDQVRQVVEKVVRKDLGKQPEATEQYGLFQAFDQSDSDSGRWLDDTLTIGFYGIGDQHVLVVKQLDQMVASRSEDFEGGHVLRVSLADLAALNTDGCVYPSFLQDAFDFLDEHSSEAPFASDTSTEAIEDAINRCIRDLDRGHVPDYSKISPIVVCGMVRQYLWALPECLLTAQLVQAFNAAVGLSSKEHTYECLRACVWCLPELNRSLLARLCAVASYGPVHNEAVASSLGPVVAWTREQEDETQRQAGGPSVFESLLEAGPAIFEADPPSRILAVARATHVWQSQADDELTINVNDVIFLTSDSGDWYMGETISGSGLVPCNHVAIVAGVQIYAWPGEEEEEDQQSEEPQTHPISSDESSNQNAGTTDLNQSASENASASESQITESEESVRETIPEPEISEPIVVERGQKSEEDGRVEDVVEIVPNKENGDDVDDTVGESPASHESIKGNIEVEDGEEVVGEKEGNEEDSGDRVETVDSDTVSEPKPRFDSGQVREVALLLARLRHERDIKESTLEQCRQLERELAAGREKLMELKRRSQALIDFSVDTLAQ